MAKLKLAKNELLILQERSVILNDGGTDQNLDELVLTSKNLILVDTRREGLFRSATYCKRFPLTTLQHAADGPQALVAKLNGTYWLQVLFDSEVVRLRFPNGSRRTCERWAYAVRQVASGNTANIPSEDSLPPDIANLVDSAKDLVGGFVGGGKPKIDQKAAPARPALRSIRCPGCHAPLTGKQGSAATCPYCDTVTTL